MLLPLRSRVRGGRKQNWIKLVSSRKRSREKALCLEKYSESTGRNSIIQVHTASDGRELYMY